MTAVMELPKFFSSVCNTGYYGDVPNFKFPPTPPILYAGPSKTCTKCPTSPTLKKSTFGHADFGGPASDNLMLGRNQWTWNEPTPCLGKYF